MNLCHMHAGEAEPCFWSLHGGGSFLDNINHTLIIHYSIMNTQAVDNAKLLRNPALQLDALLRLDLVQLAA